MPHYKTNRFRIRLYSITSPIGDIGTNLKYFSLFILIIYAECVDNNNNLSNPSAKRRVSKYFIFDKKDPYKHFENKIFKFQKNGF